MSIFQSGYAQHYDIFYRDKNYKAEADYVADLIRCHRPGSKTILDLGCGSGRHDDCFAEMEFSTVGVDFSSEMIQLGMKRSLHADGKQKFVLGDIRQVRLDSTFDAVVSLFHVMSYQTANQDVNDAFATARSHLSLGGLFIFDFWYGPAVLTDRPVVRCKEFCADGLTVVRVAEPELLHDRNLVRIVYNIFAKEAGEGRYSNSSEIHTMRYFFEPELHELCRGHGFEVVGMHGWMTDRAPDLSTWYATAVCRVM